MLGAALLAITIVPILMGYLIRGKIKPRATKTRSIVFSSGFTTPSSSTGAPEESHRHWLLAVVVLAVTWIPLKRMGSEFMPPLNEGDLLYMPTTLPGHLYHQGQASCSSRPTGLSHRSRKCTTPSARSAGRKPLPIRHPEHD
jgi:Cu/Ag efflux pump CusA